LVPLVGAKGGRRRRAGVIRPGREVNF